jgi:predicted AlkP superfamily pyrophosphatase or phosphodiesterase
VLVSPEGDRLLLGFSKALMKAENIGQDDTTDYLSISVSSVDAVNHFFGPSSLENEDVVLQLDRTLEELLDFVDKQIGLEHTLVVLSSDHGMAEMPEYATELGYPSGRLFGDQVLELARGISGRLFGNEDLVRDFFRPYLYLDNKAVAGSNLDPHTVAAAIAVELERQPGIGGAIASHKVPHGSENAVATAVRNNHNPQRAGDVYIFQQPYWFMFERGPVAAMHGSPWGYDTHVPILFVGPGIKPMHVHRRVHPIDIAPTLSALLNMPPPAAAQGTILAEVLKR